MSISERLRIIKPSPTLAMNAKAISMQRAGIDVVNFGVGEPDFETPVHIREAAVRAMEQGMTRYTDVGGIQELKNAIVDKFAKDNGLYYKPEEVMASCGGKHALYNIAQAVLNPGDEVIIQAPYWVSYPPIVQLADGNPVIVETDEQDDFKLLPQALERAITPRTKLVILNSPCNPTGSVYTRLELEGLAEVLRGRDLFIVSDDIYEKLTFDGRPFCNIAQLSDEMRSKTLVVNGVSKTYAMTGWRIGYVAGPRELIVAMTNIQSQSTSNPTSIAQVAAVTALRGPEDIVAEMVRAFDVRRQRLVQRLNAIPGVHCNMPGGAFYAFANMSSYYGASTENGPITDSAKLGEYLLAEGNVALVPGLAFGADSFMRFSYATSLAAIEKGLDKIEAALKKLS